ncbi:UdgX family uracil-DNA binding protein [Celeribacter indicus]|uniref:Type-4 uracil-DNA glycosylase n=1 Tax=Celeribacter indicus TaxID=1208324 RepID=A0A0B5DXS2_9RHOB|nr:UdgX family uracil-DNA binding protein [Celeribacter indicus]AJE45546.1 phage SPO1 DNA polymerase-related protein [Celeribacter indicus]SDW86332.1 DNA polymerase [Celeribacter indicus]
MHEVILPETGTVAAWRREARRLAAAGVPGAELRWSVGRAEPDLFGKARPAAVPAADPVALTLPRAALPVLETALHHRDPERFARAYEIVLRLARGELRWGDRTDPALCRLLAQEKAVRREIHKMHAFVRFREIGVPGAPRRSFAAWFEPDHPVLEAAAPFFTRRFGDMDWIIATPRLTARFEAGKLSFGSARGADRPPEDATEELWRVYFANIFNPARLRISAMTSEMPRRYWKNLPEAALIEGMIRSAPGRAGAMQAALPTEPHPRAGRIRSDRPKSLMESDVTLETFKSALDACHRCPIGDCATQGVPGEGPEGARLMVVGEQPGDQEDLAGRPFVGPAGRLFDACAEEAGLDRAQTYVTNAVKHFKFTPRGKRRLHQRPNAGEIKACRWWLDLERKAVRPKALLALGATAARALTGSGEAMTKRRGKVEEAEDGTPVLLSVHPAYLLRLRDAGQRAEARAAFVEDLRKAARLK